jgi:hypothetical protein
VFAKGLGPVMSRIIRYGASLLIAQVPAHPASDIFKSGADITGEERKPEKGRSAVS